MRRLRCAALRPGHVYAIRLIGVDDPAERPLAAVGSAAKIAQTSPLPPKFENEILKRRPRK